MLEQWFDILLTDDVVISSHAATEGGHRCLDYLPGSVFLGALAARMFKKWGADILLSGRLRCGSALPLLGTDIAFPMPLSLHTFKEHDDYTIINGLSVTEEEIKGWAEDDRNIRQLRACYITLDGRLLLVAMERTMKSAISRDHFDRAANEKLFGYQYIRRGQCFTFPVQADDDLENVLHEVSTLLTGGSIRVGRSRSAEFSRVRITTRATPPAIPEGTVATNGIVSFFLMSDLALYHQGVPNLRPKPENFGLASGEFIPEKSFIRTRNYAPWNSHRNCRDPERQLLVQGSVISFQLPGNDHDGALEAIRTKVAPRIGAYRNEGLGWVLCNPEFIITPPEKLTPVDPPEKNAPSVASTPNTPLASLINIRMTQNIVKDAAQGLGEKWAKEWWKAQQEIARMQGRVPGKSQWSQLREFAFAAGDDLNGFREKISNFTGRAERRSFWQGSRVKRDGNRYTMAKLILKDFGEDSIGRTSREYNVAGDGTGTFITMAFHHAAREIGRKFDR